MAKPKNDLEKLKKIWYKKLKDSGFGDIEYDENWMKSCLPRPNATIRDPLVRETVQAYYNMASHFLNEYKFEEELDKVIWEYHTEGISPRNIIKLLKAAKIKRKVYRKFIEDKIKRFEATMKEMYLVR